MHAETTILELVGLIYEAAGMPERWPAFLRRMRGVSGSMAALLYLHDISRKEERVAIQVGVDPAYIQLYQKQFVGKNVYMIQGKPHLWAGNVCPSERLCPDEEAKKSEFYNDWIVPQGQGPGLVGVVAKHEAITSNLGLIRPQGTKYFGREEISFLQTLMPHLQRALQLHHRLADLRMQKRATGDVLDRWPLGVILLDEEGHVLFLNQKAEQIIDQMDGLFMHARSLCASRAHQTQELRGLIHDAIQTSLGQGGGVKGGGSMALMRPSLKRALEVVVTPACSNKSLFVEPRASAVVFVGDPESVAQPPEDLLAHLYGLTPAESRLALLLMQGKSVRQAADELSVTLNTARTHLKHIFDKTETRRQAELVRLLLSGPAQLCYPASQA